MSVHQKWPRLGAVWDYCYGDLVAVQRQFEQRLLLYLAYSLLIGVTTFISLKVLGVLRNQEVALTFQGMYAWHTTLNYGFWFLLCVESWVRLKSYNRFRTSQLWWLGMASFAVAYLVQRTLVFEAVVDYNPALILYYEANPGTRPGVGMMLVWCLAFWFPLFAVEVALARWLERRIASATPLAEEPLHISLDQGRLVLNVDQLTHISMEDHYARVYWRGDEGPRSDLIRITMKEALENLPQGAFVQIHRSHLVRQTAIEALARQGRGWVVRVGGQELPVSRQRQAEVRSLLSNPG